MIAMIATKMPRVDFRPRTMKALDRMISSIRTVTSNPARWIAFPLLFLGTGLILVQPCAGNPFEWQATGFLTTNSVFHSATLLTDGKVLVVGGSRPNGASLARSEVYDPANGTWAHSGNLAQRRNWH